MNLFRLLLLGIAAYTVWRLLKRSRRDLAAPVDDLPPAYEATARCDGCGTHLPVRALSPRGRCGRCSA
jgi:hypothetical protein